MLRNHCDRLLSLNRLQHRMSNGETSRGVACVDQGLDVTSDDVTEVFELSVERISGANFFRVSGQRMLPADGTGVVVPPDLQAWKGQSTFGTEEVIAVFRGLKIEGVVVAS